MSGYRGRSNVNVSHFLSNLNTIPAPDEHAVDTYNPDDLALFTNTQFFDFDMGEPLGDFASNGSFNGATQKTDQKQQKQRFEAIDASFLGMQPVFVDIFSSSSPPFFLFSFFHSFSFSTFYIFLPPSVAFLLVDSFL